MPGLVKDEIRVRPRNGARLLLLAPAFVLLLAALLPVGWRSPVPLCAINAFTGLDCAGCGMTRAFLLIGHGRVSEATDAHPLAVPAFLIVAGLAAAGAVRAVREERNRARIPLDPPLPKGE
jgi:hypothetical protein